MYEVPTNSILNGIDTLFDPAEYDVRCLLIEDEDGESNFHANIRERPPEPIVAAKLRKQMGV